METSHRIKELIKDSVSVSTRATYNSGYQALLNLSCMNNLCDDVSESTLMLVATDCYGFMNMLYQTMKKLVKNKLWDLTSSYPA